MSKRIEVGIFAENVVLWNSGSSIQTIEADIYLTLKDASDFTEEHKLILILPNRKLLQKQMISSELVLHRRLWDIPSSIPPGTKTSTSNQIQFP
ncbi:hypothetical protein CEXT_489851 [Caerostris extrusa]|uniref:Uncharacterized protein n=1 Tax=Caerostris extrusa TaxID=172846 RepID=A0AAV4TVC6_CAEEX|nr:hypothetical protein CEXT_489851 [Caerostris extrusa]